MKKHRNKRTVTEGKLYIELSWTVLINPKRPFSCSIATSGWSHGPTYYMKIRLCVAGTFISFIGSFCKRTYGVALRQTERPRDKY
ncbi:hypothetical protein SK128_011395 [Halocaridina rubra]|uniref:Uncharacterized protein n=1 Tax=Halocaridina rubra TaxID=373956 RepID=A0AAN9AFW1_HALRR